MEVGSEVKVYHMEKAAASARLAGEKALEDARPHLLTALKWVSEELQKTISRLEGS